MNEIHFTTSKIYIVITLHLRYPLNYICVRRGWNICPLTFWLVLMRKNLSTLSITFDWLVSANGLLLITSIACFPCFNDVKESYRVLSDLSIEQFVKETRNSLQRTCNEQPILQRNQPEDLFIQVAWRNELKEKCFDFPYIYSEEHWGHKISHCWSIIKTSLITNAFLGSLLIWKYSADVSCWEGSREHRWITDRSRS